jgi:hypothetical protein
MLAEANPHMSFTEIVREQMKQVDVVAEVTLKSPEEI